MSFFEENKYTIGAFATGAGATGGSLYLGHYAAPEAFKNVMSNPMIAICVGAAALAVILFATILASSYEADSNAKKKEEEQQNQRAQYRAEANQRTNTSRDESRIDGEDLGLGLPASPSEIGFDEPSKSFSYSNA